MSFLDRLFRTEKEAKVPDVHFGRYTDVYKTAEQYDAWDQAQDLFEEGKYLESYRNFLLFLSDPVVENVHYNEEEQELVFEFFQGSKKITGFANQKRVVAEAKIAQTNQLDAAFMEGLIRRNFDLKYARFALDDQQRLTIKFDTSTIDGSPYKLYAALKELATNADKQDDLLQDEFSDITLVGVDHLKMIPDAEKHIKYHFFKQQLEAVAYPITDHGKKVEAYSGGVGYHLLNAAYQLDYLIRPEGFMMETLERVHRQYFAKDDQTMAEKVVTVRAEFEQLLARPATEYYLEMYQVTSTFGITNPTDHDRVRSFIDGELGNMDWYSENGYYDTALAVPGYIVGYCLFNFAIPLPDRACFHLYYQLMEPAYFSALGFDFNYYDTKKEKFNHKAIRRAIKQIVKKNRTRFPKLKPALSSLDFTDRVSFAKSYLLMIRNLDMTKIM